MASLKQLEANRRNALKSTGPKTEEGKRKSRNNALKHGITCAIHVPMRHEDEEDLLEIRERMYAAWNPADDREALQLEVVIAQFMNMRRAERIEANFLDQSLGARQQKYGVPEVVSWNDDFGISMLMAARENERALKLIDRYTRRAHKLYSDAVKLLEAMQKERRRNEDRQADRQLKTKIAGIHVLKPAESGKLGSFCKESEPAMQAPQTVQRC